jgi:hypothetical protein
MERFGPTYCETPETITGIFPVEPWNAISSGVIVLFGIASLFLVMRRSPRAIELYVASVLLILNGTGSILWHGLRTRWALNFDVIPALIFVLLVAFLWARRVAPGWQVAVAGALLVLVPVGVRFLAPELPMVFRFGSSILVVALLAMWLIVRSFAISREAALTGALALGSAVTALTFRSIDPFSCDEVAMGTHFLWHVFLSAAAFLCMLTVVRLREARPAGAAAAAA